MIYNEQYSLIYKLLNPSLNLLPTILSIKYYIFIKPFTKVLHKEVGVWNNMSYIKELTWFTTRIKSHKQKEVTDVSSTQLEK